MARQRNQPLDCSLLPGLYFPLYRAIKFKLVTKCVISYCRFAWPCRQAITHSAVTRKIFTTAGCLTTCAAYLSAFWQFTPRESITLSGVKT